MTESEGAAIPDEVRLPRFTHGAHMWDQAQSDPNFHTYQKTEPTRARQVDHAFAVDTLEGIMVGEAGDYLCVGEAGDCWPVKRSIFEANHIRIA